MHHIWPRAERLGEGAVRLGFGGPHPDPGWADHPLRGGWGGSRGGARRLCLSLSRGSEELLQAGLLGFHVDFRPGKVRVWVDEGIEDVLGPDVGFSVAPVGVWDVLTMGEGGTCTQ